jgi:hypothetical protein
MVRLPAHITTTISNTITTITTITNNTTNFNAMVDG